MESDLRRRPAPRPSPHRRTAKMAYAAAALNAAFAPIACWMMHGLAAGLAGAPAIRALAFLFGAPLFLAAAAFFALVGRGFGRRADSLR